jgi:AcrR family transcriptional regulator
MGHVRTVDRGQDWPAGMSPRRADPRLRSALVNIAARLLHEEGPQALTARRVAAEAGVSTMPVYTRFGTMGGLVREIVREGFARLQYFMTCVADSEDPVADMAMLGRAYRYNALVNPHLYAVMFGGPSLAVFSLSEEDRHRGRYTLVNVVRCAGRCRAAGRFRDANDELVAHHMWTATHGLVTLELGDFLISPCDADMCFEGQLISLMVGAGDTLEAATESVRFSAVRFGSEVEAIETTDPLLGQ